MQLNGAWEGSGCRCWGTSEALELGFLAYWCTKEQSVLLFWLFDQSLGWPWSLRIED